MKIFDFLLLSVLLNENWPGKRQNCITNRFRSMDQYIRKGQQETHKADVFIAKSPTALIILLEYHTYLTGCQNKHIKRLKYKFQDNCVLLLSDRYEIFPKVSLAFREMCTRSNRKSVHITFLNRIWKCSGLIETRNCNGLDKYTICLNQSYFKPFRVSLCQEVIVFLLMFTVIMS